MAWSYKANMASVGFIEGDYLQVVWFNEWTVTEISGGPAGKIRLYLNVHTSEKDLGTQSLPGFWVWSKWGTTRCASITPGSTCSKAWNREVIDWTKSFYSPQDVLAARC